MRGPLGMPSTAARPCKVERLTALLPSSGTHFELLERRRDPLPAPAFATSFPRPRLVATYE
eukprot:scaffold1_cov402-Prasinococcus_capsulatus_cf.AAC.54